MNPRPLDRVPPPQAVRAILDDLAIKLLAAKPRALIASDDRIQESRREICGIRRCRRARHRRFRIGDQPLDERDRARRCRHDLARALAEAQAELQHVPGAVRARPFRQLVAPCGVELRAAQAVRVAGGKQPGARAVGPFQFILVLHETRALILRVNAHQARRRLRPSPRGHRPACRPPARSARPAARRMARAQAPRRAPIPAPARVLPLPRPPSRSHVVHGPPPCAASGGS